MVDVWVTADHHFGHWTSAERNIIKFCDRPFDDIDHMDTELVNRWCEVVQPKDRVYYLGDFALVSPEEALEYIRRLTGRIIFMPGSHDRWLEKMPDWRWEEDPLLTHEPLQNNMYELKYHHQHITLCHYAMRSWPRSFRGSMHLYGHSHGRLPKYGRSMDIGVDTNDFYPYRLDDVIALLSREETHGD